MSAFRPPQGVQLLDTVPESLEAAFDRHLASPSPEGDVRAFSHGNLTAIVKWQSVRPDLGADSPFHLAIRLRRGTSCFDHSTTLHHLRLLARTCAHHARQFVTNAASAGGPMATATPPRRIP